jgi:hypothetical protein
MNVEAFLSRCTLDIIGLAGFGYDFATLDGNELAAAFRTIFGAAVDRLPRSARVSRQGLPIYRACPHLLLCARMLTGHAADRAHQTAQPGDELHAPHRDRAHCGAQGRSHVRLNSLGLLRRIADISRRPEAAQSEKLAGTRARDILSLLVHANVAADSHQRLSDEALLARAPSLGRGLC